MSDGQNTNAFLSLLKGVAPTIATMLGGPLAGAAVSFVAGKLGLPEKSLDAVQNAFAGMSGDDLVKMKQLDLEFQEHMATIGISIDVAQIGVNIEEAKSESIFVAGWRPFVGWVCGSGLLYAAVLLPIFEFAAKVIFGYKGLFPIIDWAILSNVLIGMLGLGAMRSYDKKQGTSNGH